MPARVEPGGPFVYSRPLGATKRLLLGAVVALSALCWPTPAPAQVPANDDFDVPAAIGALPFTAALDTAQATAAVDDPFACAGGGQHTVWYRFTPAATMRVQADAFGSAYGAGLSVYTGTRGALALVACSRATAAGPLNAQVAFDAASGTTYHLLADTNGPGGALQLKARQVLSPANDDFDAATLIGAFPFEEAVDTRPATIALDDPLSNCGVADRSIWYRISPVQRTRVELDTLKSVYDTTLAVYTGTRGALTEVTCSNDQTYYGMAKLGFDAEAGTTYHVAVGGWVSGPGGDWVLTATKGLLASSLGLAVSRKTVSYGGTVRVTAHLDRAADIANPTVSIFKTPAGGTKTVVASGLVDSQGNFSVLVKPKAKTVFVAEWAGDARYASAKSASRTVAVHARALVRLSGFYRRAHGYALYHLGGDPKVTGSVVPKHAGKSLQFVAQAKLGGAWTRIARRDFRLGANGSVSVFFVNPPQGIRFRARTAFGGDTDHLGDTSPWVYFRVTA